MEEKWLLVLVKKGKVLLSLKFDWCSDKLNVKLTLEVMKIIGSI